MFTFTSRWLRSKKGLQESQGHYSWFKQKKKIEYQIRNLGAAFKHIFGPKSWNLIETIFKGSKAKGEHVEASL